MAEDNPHELSLLQKGFSTDPAPPEWEHVYSGDEAVARLTRAGESLVREFDLVLLDLYLPRLSALDVLVALQKANVRLNTPVVIYSGYASPHVMQRLLTLGASHGCQKPFDLDGYYLLARELNELMETKSGEAEES